MTLRDDLGQGLARLSDTGHVGRLALDDKGFCTVPLALPPSDRGGPPTQLHVDLQLAKNGKLFTLSSLLATLGSQPSAPLLAALLNRQYYSNQTNGMSYALSAEKTTLLLVYHWILDEVTPEQFLSLFEEFSLAVLDQLAKFVELAKLDPDLQTIRDVQ